MMPKNNKKIKILLEAFDDASLIDVEQTEINTDFNDMLQKAKQMQQKMKEAQDEIKKYVEGVSWEIWLLY